jgi:hypothetical protein
LSEGHFRRTARPEPPSTAIGICRIFNPLCRDHLDPMRGALGAAIGHVEDWLRSLGLSEYAQALPKKNGIDVSVLPHLTDQDLQDVGVRLGHRRKMLAAIAALKVASDFAAVSPLTAAEPRPPRERPSSPLPPQPLNPVSHRNVLRQRTSD